MKNLPAPRSCAAAARPASAHLFFRLYPPTFLLFARPDPADANVWSKKGHSAARLRTTVAAAIRHMQPTTRQS